ncbi:hypothetical protein O9G_002053 [Rozella allomycis CSF55]|uniref:Uncharacterized protein n=1 Tax=Rozella allomycis (strain CSF55) TaxID=988480 RepID=A0A075AW48_ROZAC|nr:hypothetical protein O9G_002053 [Rozella allomycis CSF55]|eukprot:EPZ34480.1 hypothetical protein O9G_002053 [Rozella allomycis CSF55]
MKLFWDLLYKDRVLNTQDLYYQFKKGRWLPPKISALTLKKLDRVAKAYNVDPHKDLGLPLLVKNPTPLTTPEPELHVKKAILRKYFIADQMEKMPELEKQYYESQKKEEA